MAASSSASVTRGGPGASSASCGCGGRGGPEASSTSSSDERGERGGGLMDFLDGAINVAKRSLWCGGS